MVRVRVRVRAVRVRARIPQCTMCSAAWCGMRTGPLKVPCYL